MKLWHNSLTAALSSSATVTVLVRLALEFSFGLSRRLPLWQCHSRRTGSASRPAVSPHCVGLAQYKGQHRSDMCGLAILDEDNGVIVTDCLGDSLELARELLSEICEAGLVAMVPLVNSSPRARFHLGAAGELLWKDQP